MTPPDGAPDAQRCPGEDDLEHFVSCALAPADRARIERHLDECAACAAHAEDVRANLLVLAPISGALRESSALADVAREGRFIDGFRLIRQIGRGGSGVVYEAEQLNPPRIVALKLLHTGAGPRDARLFHRETAALARLQHPGVAALYASGTTPDDDHYLTMEYVRGAPLTRFVSDARLQLVERLRLFLSVCDAVAYAHRRGVIHRDLKPSNILVVHENEPRAKVLDFGLARILEPEGQDASHQPTFTEFANISGTLPYMSPEQARGDPQAISVQTDVYALGVVLYEMLLERLPYDLDRDSVTASIRAICERPPARPRDVRADLPRDVETILLTALEKDAARRYRTTDALAADIERFITHQPIHARPPSVLYVAHRFARRNLALVVGIAGVILALAAGLSVALRQADLIARARDDERFAKENAQREAAIARDAHELLKSTLGAANPWNIASLEDLPRDLRVADALGRAADALGDESKDPLVRAVVHDVLANTLIGLAELDRALEHARTALALRAPLLGLDHPQTLESVRTLAAVHHWREELDEAERLLNDGLAIASRALGDESPLSLRLLADTGRIAQRRGRLRDAESIYERLIAAHARTLDANDADAIDALRVLGLVRHDLGDYESADALLSESIARANVARIADHPETIAAMSVLAGVRDRLGRYDDADDLRERVLAYRRRVLGDEHPRTIEALNNLAVGRYQRGHHAHAEALFREVLQLRARILGDDHPGLLIVRNNLAAVCYELGRFVDAEAYAHAAAEGARRVLPAGHWQRGVFIKRHGECLAALGRYPEAEGALLEAHALLHDALGPGHDATSKTAEAIAAMYLRWGRADEANRWSAATPQPRPDDPSPK